MIISLVFVSHLLLHYCQAETWTISVHTGKERFGGTDSNVFIRLFNSRNEPTSEYQLSHYNWQPGGDEFPIRNLFEIGALDRFRIRTEDIGSVSKIHIRHDSFPPFHADWFLDQVVVERQRDGTKFQFQCSCWLRRDRPFTTISVVPNRNSVDKKKTSDSTSKSTRTFVIILIILITLLISFFCYYNRSARRRRDPSLSISETVEQSQQEPSSLLDPYQSQPERLPSPPSRSRLYIDTICRWKSFRHGLPSYSNTRTSPPPPPPTTTTAAVAMSARAMPTIDQPPSYEDLYPNSTSPINPSSNLNS